MSEWFDSLPEHEQNEWAVAATLRAKRWLADQRDGYDPHERNLKMLATVEPKARVCCRCGARGERMVAITGDWFCSRHDPLATCPEQTGVWGCSRFAPHHFPHRFRRLEGDTDRWAR